MKSSSTSLSGGLQAAQLEIDRWRVGNDRRRRIPESFWQRAVQLAQTHSINSISQAMRLSHEGIKARLESAPTLKKESLPARFVELAPVPPKPGAAHLPMGLTLQLSDGANRHVQVTGADTHSATQLVTAFFGTVTS